MNNDLISREALKGLISEKSIPVKFEEGKRGNWQYASGLLLSDIYKTIDNAPTVKPKQGEWIIQPHSMIMRCSLCENEETAEGIGIVDTNKHFCSNCGAAMRGA